jgi:hypothetical protein
MINCEVLTKTIQISGEDEFVNIHEHSYDDDENKIIQFKIFSRESFKCGYKVVNIFRRFTIFEAAVMLPRTDSLK